ncbi:MAG: HAD family hydrolase [Oscillospiraceae bacterium]|nr:HAD family hydrolase [Oscillospiraceae bacterium]
MLKVIVFDLGGTLMEYKGMPLSWVEYYESAFEAVNLEFDLNLSKEDIQKSCDVLKSKNARVVYREIEYTPSEIFNTVTEHWQKKIDINAIINSFYKGHELMPVIYDDTIDCLSFLKKKGVKIATLTDLPTAMPDEIFKKDISGLLSHLDLYVSSLTCGFRKPNKSGLAYIAEHYGVNVQKLVFIGDEEKDIKTAINAGCISILIDRKNEHKNYGQDLSITSLYELHKIINKYY